MQVVAVSAVVYRAIPRVGSLGCCKSHQQFETWPRRHRLVPADTRPLELQTGPETPLLSRIPGPSSFLNYKISLRMRKPKIFIGENKGADYCETDPLYGYYNFFFFLNPKFPAFSHLLCLYKMICVGPGRRPKLLVFSCKGSNDMGSDAIKRSTGFPTRSDDTNQLYSHRKSLEVLNLELKKQMNCIIR